MKRMFLIGLFLVVSAASPAFGLESAVGTYSAVATFPLGAPDRMPIPVKITLTGVSSQGRVAKFVESVGSGNREAIRETLRSSTEGLLTPVGRGSFNLGLVLVQEVETGLLIVGIADRPIWPYPNTTQLQVHGYEFGVVYLRLDKEGAGQGEIVPFGRLLPDPENGFNVERKSQHPVRLNSVHREKD